MGARDKARRAWSSVVARTVGAGLWSVTTSVGSVLRVYRASRVTESAQNFSRSISALATPHSTSRRTSVSIRACPLSAQGQPMIECTLAYYSVETRVRLRPLLAVKVLHCPRFAPIAALVDSGADTST